MRKLWSQEVIPSGGGVGKTELEVQYKINLISFPRDVDCLRGHLYNATYIKTSHATLSFWGPRLPEAAMEEEFFASTIRVCHLAL